MTTLLVACGPAPSVGTSSSQPDVLPATESAKDFGDFVVYFNAINTDQLSPEIASQYGIVRSKSRAMLNVAVHRKLDGGRTEAVPARVVASATNLNGQLRNVALREIREDTAIYYIGESSVTDGEALTYSVEATPADASAPLAVRFQRQFFSEE